jgi:hypothetical protein
VSGAADVFYVHTNTYYRRRRWNAPINHAEADEIREVIAAPNEVGPFSVVGDVYAPRYREATVYSLFTHKYDGLAARELAFADVDRAFRRFLAMRDKERPIVLVGYGQGGLHVLGLLRAHFQGEPNPLRRRLVAAYVIGHATPVNFVKGLSPPLPVCGAATEARCLVSYVDFEKRFDEEMDRARQRTLLWDADGKLQSEAGGQIVCVNPLSWRADESYAGPEKHLGAASATGIARGQTPPAISKALGARCERGILVVDRPSKSYLRRKNFLGGKWKAQAYNLFYFDLARNVEARFATLQEKLSIEPEMLEPIDMSVELGESPINRVPN